MRTSTWWNEAPTVTSYAALERDTTADVVVVGAGITGLTTALLLARAGRRVVVVEADRVGSGTTGHTSAHLTVETDTDLDALKRRVGERGAFAGVRAQRAGIERIAALDAEMGGAGGFRRVPGWLWGTTDKDLSHIERIAELYRACGERAPALVDVPLPGAKRRGMCLDDQALFHPVRYVRGLAELAVAAGVRIHERSEVVDWDSGSPAKVVLRSGPTVEAEHVVLATHTPPGFVPAVQTRMAPYLSFLVVARPRQPVPEGLYWDMAEPYHYVRPLDDGRILVGGEDLQDGRKAEEAFARLEEWTRDELETAEITTKWSHMWFEPADGLPYIGALPTRTGAWVVTGLSGTGLTWGTFGAGVIAAAIGGEPLEEADVFSPGRLALVGSADRIVHDQASVLWHMVADRFKPSGGRAPEELAPGEGRVVTIDGRKVGVYRDESGVLHGVSTVCRHLGCIVAWNQADRTWDCPCHGGRYHADGRRFWGPPMSDLETRKL